MEKEPWQIYLPMALFVYSRFHWNPRHDRNGAKRSRGCVLVPQIIRSGSKTPEFTRGVLFLYCILLEFKT